MNNAVRAAMASALIYPGAGLFLMRHYARGCIFAVPTTLILCMLFTHIMKVASAISDQLVRNEIPFNVMVISQKLHLALFDSPYWTDGKWILLASWALSIFSSYFVGKKIDLEKSRPITQD